MNEKTPLRRRKDKNNLGGEDMNPLLIITCYNRLERTKSALASFNRYD